LTNVTQNGNTMNKSSNSDSVTGLFRRWPLLQ